MRWLFFFLFLFSAQAEATIKVAVIDTGINLAILDNKEANGLCPTGHIDFTGTGLHDSDYREHGTNISGIIHKFASNTKYCQIIYKYWSEQATPAQTLDWMIRSIRAAVAAKVDIINISSGGAQFSYAERLAVTEALDQDIIVVTAAGNSGALLAHCTPNSVCPTESTYYPAMYDSRIKVVGSADLFGRPHSFSNKGPLVNTWEIGKGVQGAYGPKLSGTSQAAAVHTGKLIFSKIP